MGEKRTLMKRICVFCGSSPGTAPVYNEAARQLGFLLADRGIELIYGGASVGTMGVLADAVLERGGRVTGVIPASLVAKEIAHAGVTEMRVVDSMHQRKAAMAELADAFIALPGGLGTLDEYFEIITWSMLGMHTRPCGLLNISRYYDRLVDFLDFAVAQGFIKPVHRSMVLVDDDATSLLERFAAYRPFRTEKQR